MSGFAETQWGLILGGSSGFGLATAHKLAEHGLNLLIVHRDRRGAMARIEPEFEKLRGHGIRLVTVNADALDPERRRGILDEFEQTAGERGRVRVLLHSIAFGNLKLIAPLAQASGPDPTERLAERLGMDTELVRDALDELLAEGFDHAQGLASPPCYAAEAFLEEEDFTRTVHAMGTSLLDWTRAVFERGRFAADARVFGLTSEGNSLAWRGYAAVAAAKSALESLCRAIAVEFGPHGVRCNVIQAGITDTPALRAIPGHLHLMAHARLRNPFRRLTTPRDVADVIYLLARDEAAWINGEVIRVDGGEHVSGATR